MTDKQYGRTSLLPENQNTTRIRRSFDSSTLSIMVSLMIIVMVGGCFAFNALANWWTNWQDDLHYGNPRTYQTDQFVGQGDSPTHPDHFIVVNLPTSQVVVVQINPLDAKRDRNYYITKTSDPKIPVTLSFRQTGNALAMYVIIGDTNPYSVELVSDGKQFVSPH